MPPRIAALVPAAGKGERLGPGVPKALRVLGGQPLLVHAVRALATAQSVDVVVVAAPREEIENVRAALAGQALAPPQVRVVAGGATRQQSVWCALDTLPAEVEIVLVHDAARPLVPPALVDAVVSAVRQGRDAVIPVLPVNDTIKQVAEDGAVLATVARTQLRAVQTPQGFTRTALVAAHRAAQESGLDATDDAGLVEAAGGRVWTIPGSQEALKVTRPLDLVVAEALWAARRAD